jgi:hypothetical protein
MKPNAVNARDTCLLRDAVAPDTREYGETDFRDFKIAFAARY